MMIPSHAPSERRWRDHKKHLWMMGLVIPLLPFSAAAMTGVVGDIAWWTGPIVIMFLLPLIDLVIGGDTSNPPDWAVDQLDSSRWYRWLVWAYIPLQYAGLVYACHVVTTKNMSWIDLVGYALTVGVVGGVGINTAHELGHKKEKTERWMSRLALAQSGYGHFYVEHNRGHHLRVATPEDPASSRLGESFWAFLPRTVVGSFASAWEIESRRLTSRGHRVISHRNEVLIGLSMTAALFAGLTITFGIVVMPFLFIQAVAGFWLLEVVNYIEHYGLLRQTTPTGRYERCQPEHSWNANHRVSNLFLYQLQRHSDHHAHPTRRYQTLRHFEEAPQLPSGYAGMLVLACVPPLWRRVMDPKVAAHYDGDLTKANIHPNYEWPRATGG